MKVLAAHFEGSMDDLGSLLNWFGIENERERPLCEER